MVKNLKKKQKKILKKKFKKNVFCNYKVISTKKYNISLKKIKSFYIKSFFYQTNYDIKFIKVKLVGNIINLNSYEIICMGLNFFYFYCFKNLQSFTSIIINKFKLKKFISFFKNKIKKVSFLKVFRRFKKSSRFLKHININFFFDKRPSRLKGIK
jgi:hypothetical protein